MITAETVKGLASKLQTTELNVRREYCQHLFLSYFYQQPHTDQIFFKGGTALRIVYNSPRFSEDLDFSASLTNIKMLDDAVLGALDSISRENVDVELAEAKTTSGGYLSIINFRGDGAPIAIQLEISLREGKKRGEAVTVVSEFIPAYTIIALEREQLIHEKIQALLTRKKARDFYDLYFLLRGNLILPGERHALPPTLETVRNTKIDFERELKEFLPKSHWAIIRGFPSTLEREIQRFV
jgi:predicted nucleotidyltransferase component of viral defense system